MHSIRPSHSSYNNPSPSHTVSSPMGHHCLNHITIHMQIHRQWLKGSTVMPDRHMCPQKYAHHLNFVHNTEMTLIIAHQLKENKTSIRSQENSECTKILGRQNSGQVHHMEFHLNYFHCSGTDRQRTQQTRKT